MGSRIEWRVASFHAVIDCFPSRGSPAKTGDNPPEWNVGGYLCMYHRIAYRPAGFGVKTSEGRGTLKLTAISPS